MSAVFCIEIVQIRRMLEIVCIYLAAFNDVVGLNIISKFLDIKSNVLFSQNSLYDGQNLRMRCGRGGNRNGFSGKRSIINRGIIAVSGVFYNRYYCTIIFLGNEIGYLFTFKGGFQSLDNIGIFIAFLYGKNVTVSRGRTFKTECILCRIELCFDRIVRVDYGIINVFQYIGKLCGFYLFKFNIMGILFNIKGSCGNAGTILQFNES